MRRSIVLLGHSERRANHGETSALVAAKARQALAHGLDVMICLGETLAERQAGRAKEVVIDQLHSSVPDDIPQNRLMIAYEPVWAIGTGMTASAEQAQEVHAFIRGLVRELAGSEAANAVRIQYGGSMKPANAAELLAQPDIDGGLIGGAALDASSFGALIDVATEA